MYDDDDEYDDEDVYFKNECSFGWVWNCGIVG